MKYFLVTCAMIMLSIFIAQTLPDSLGTKNEMLIGAGIVVLGLIFTRIFSKKKSFKPYVCYTPPKTDEIKDGNVKYSPQVVNNPTNTTKADDDEYEYVYPDDYVPPELDGTEDNFMNDNRQPTYSAPPMIRRRKNS